MKQLKETFYFTKTERVGITFLSMLCLVFIILPHFFHQIFWDNSLSQENFPLKQFLDSIPNRVESDTIELVYFDPNTATKIELQKLGIPNWTINTIIKYREEVSPFQKPKDLKHIYNLDSMLYEKLLPFIKIERKQAPVKSFVHKAPSSNLHHLFKFNPNEISKEDLVNFGLPDKVANNWTNYLSKGGRFFRPKDVQKIYGLRELHFKQLESFIDLSSEGTYVNVNDHSVDELFTIDINKATSLEWQRLKGIGKAYARRIINFREKLGGFYSVDQVGETYYFPDSVFQSIKPYLVNSPVFRKLNLNRLSADSLALHPYLSRKKAQIIVNYRKQHGVFQRVEDLSYLKVFKRNEVDRLIPYLNLDE